MPQDQFRVFLSAVTSEFGKVRDALGADLLSRELLLRLQSDFRQEAGSDTTLKKLHAYIRDCSAVVCVIGKRSGALPPPAALTLLGATNHASRIAGNLTLEAAHPIPPGRLLP
jgi:hypothetical protein